MSKKQRVFDLEQAVREWGWIQYSKTSETWTQKRLRKKEQKNNYSGIYVGVMIDWSKIKFDDKTEWPELKETPFGGSIKKKRKKGKKKSTGSKTTDEVDEEEEDNDLGTSWASGDRSQHVDRGHTTINTLFRTKFTNNTDEDQEYTMKTEKTTRSECSASIEDTYSKGFSMGISLSAPHEICQANAGFSREFSLTNSRGQTFEEELCWGVESQIKVKKGHVAEASLVVNEKKYCGKFVVESTIEGFVYLEFTNKKKNNELIKAMNANITYVIKKYLGGNSEYTDFVKVDDSCVKIITTGQCQFRFGINQEVYVNQKPINDESVHGNSA